MPLMDDALLQDALSYAVEKHAGQTRKGKDVPYAVHPIAVGRILHDHGFANEVVAAGFLHDVTEDTDATLADVEHRFGPEVARLVDGASEHDKEASWEERKQHTLDYLEDAPLDACYVKAADKIDNVRSMRIEYEDTGEELWDKFNRGYDDQTWYHRSVLDVLDDRFDTPQERGLYDELREEVDAVFGAR